VTSSLKASGGAPETPSMGAVGCRHYLVITAAGDHRDRGAAGQEIADGFATACTGVTEVRELTIERNRVSGPGQADLIVCTAYDTAEDLVRIRGTVLRECIEKLRQQVSDFEIRELSAMA
jgi:hypothetical protein